MAKETEAKVAELKVQAYDISKEMGKLQAEFNKYNEQLIALQKQISELEQGRPKLEE